MFVFKKLFFRDTIPAEAELLAEKKLDILRFLMSITAKLLSKRAAPNYSLGENLKPQ